MPKYKIGDKVISVDEDGQDRPYPDDDFYFIQQEHESMLMDKELEEWVKGLSK